MAKAKRPRAAVQVQFRSVEQATKDRLADIRSPLHLGTAALLIAQDRYGTEYLSADEIVGALENAGVVLGKRQLVNAFNRSHDRVAIREMDGIMKYRLMTPGRREVEPLLAAGNLGVVYVEGGRPRTARRMLQQILTEVSGLVRISDPYYGIRTLDTLELLAPTCTVRFLTGRTTDSQRVLAGAIADFRRERPNTELRTAADPGTLHDRYILTHDHLFLLGHGLKDIGNRESFVISIDRNLTPDLHDQLVMAFDGRWLAGTRI